MQKTNTLTVMVNSKNYDITVQDSFTIWLSVQMHQDFKTQNISRKELLRAYVSKDFLDEMKPHHKVLYTMQEVIYPTLLYHMRPIYDELFNKGMKKHNRYRFSIHSLRHTAASHLAINGVSLLKIKAILNHSSIQSTLIYAKLQNKDTFSEIDNLYK